LRYTCTLCGKICSYWHFICIAGDEELRDHDYLRLQFLGGRNGWFSCFDAFACDQRMCPSVINYYQDFSQCEGEAFQIIAEGNVFEPVKSGQRIRLRYEAESNSWVSCIHETKCDRQTCPGTLLEARNFNSCHGELLVIHARGKKNGETIKSGDVIMLEYHGRYITIQGDNEEDDSSVNFCPGVTPPAYLSYGICSKNVFRVYRKPGGQS